MSNSLDNLSNVITIPNNILQGEFSKDINTGRFLINTMWYFRTIDVASYLGLSEYEKADYGQTLAVHGVGPGCYIVYQFWDQALKRYCCISGKFHWG